MNEFEKAQKAVNAQQNSPGKMQVTPETIKNSKTLTCECGGVIFEEKLMFKVLSALLSPSGKEETVPIPVMVCNQCGLVPSVFDPQGVLPEEIKTTLK